MLDTAIHVPPAPIQSIPNEILGEIMTLCMPGSRGTLEESFIAARRTAFTLAAVCSHWRTTAISTTQLWTKIHWLDSRHDHSVMKLIMSRSGNHSLQLRNDRSTDSENQTDEMLETIRLYHDRLSYVHDDLGPLVGMIVTGPSFQRMSRVDFLTYGMTTSEAVHMFLHCPMLEEAGIYIIQDEFEIDTPGQQGLTVVELRGFFLAFETEPDKLMNLLTAPNLVDFVGYSADRIPWTNAAFIQLLSRSKASLSVLDLCRIDLEPHEELQLIEAAPRLIELHLYGVTFVAESIIRTLEVRDGCPVVLPQLKALFIFNYAKSIKQMDLHGVIESRARNFPLKRVVLQFRDDTKDIPDFEDELFAKLWEDEIRFGYTVEYRNNDGAVIDIFDGNNQS